LQVGAVIVYTFVYHMLAPPKGANSLERSGGSCSDIDIKVESMNSDYANGYSDTIVIDDVKKEDSIVVPLLLPQSSDILPKVRVTNSFLNTQLIGNCSACQSGLILQ
jgi:hypothetical protein